MTDYSGETCHGVFLNNTGCLKTKNTLQVPKRREQAATPGDFITVVWLFETEFC